MTPIETLRHLQEEIESVEKVEREKMQEVSEKIFDPLHDKKLCCINTMVSFHKRYINDMRGKHYRVKPDKYCPFMRGIIAFMILGYTDENESVLMSYIPVMSLAVGHLLSGMHYIRYQEYGLSVQPALFRDAKTPYEQFMLFLDEYCEEISAEEFHRLFIDEVSKVEEANMRIIPKKEDTDDMSDAFDVIDESEGD